MFFTENVLNPRLMNLGLRTLTWGDLAFFDHPIRLPKLRPIDAQEHEKRWLHLLSCVRAGDTLEVLDESSVVSRLIAKIDIGTWSHTATYVGDGRVVEAITSGVAERSIGVYRMQQYRIGIYRLPDLQQESLAKMLQFARAQIGKGYNWSGVTRVALKKLLRLNLYQGGQFNFSPNDLPTLINFRLIHIV